MPRDYPTARRQPTTTVGDFFAYALLVLALACAMGELVGVCLTVKAAASLTDEDRVDREWGLVSNTPGQRSLARATILVVLAAGASLVPVAGSAVLLAVTGFKRVAPRLAAVVAVLAAVATWGLAIVGFWLARH